MYFTISDNPDQRIAADVKLFCDTFCGSNSPPMLGFVFGSNGAIFVIARLVMYTQFLYTYGWLYSVMPYAWFIFVSVLTWLLARPIVHLSYLQDLYEGAPPP